jgi:hypothetical protein
MTVSFCAPYGGSATWDTKLTVYCQGCDDTICVDGNDDACGLQSEVSWCSEAGAEYHILVHGYGSASGPFTLGTGDDGVPCTGAVACLPPEPTGACCTCLNAPYNCEITTEQVCNDWGMNWQGEGVGCFEPGVPGSGDFMSAPMLPIVDYQTVCDTLTIADTGNVTDVKIQLDISHTWVSDLEVEISHTATQNIWDRQCGSGNDIRATADDAGTETACAPIHAGPSNAVFYPPNIAGAGPLSVFDGVPVDGDWTLCITDNAGGDQGTLEEWHVIVEYETLGDPICPEWIPEGPPDETPDPDEGTD